MRPTLELSMIVKNGAGGIARCLNSVAGLVDRVLVGDTGSNDGTPEIARRHGAELVRIPWEDDFAKARNRVLEGARCDWILVLDADEMLDSGAAAVVPALLADERVWGYESWLWNYVRQLDHRSGAEQAFANPGLLEEAREHPAYFRSRNTRLFRRDSRLRFQHCVHESVVDSFELASLPRAQAGFLIHHFGYVEDAKEVRGSKEGLYHRLAFKKLAEAPASYQAQLEAGIASLEHAKNAALALEPLSRATTIDPSKQAGWLYRGICLTRLGRYEDALADLERAERLDGSNALVHSAKADAHFQIAQFVEARRHYEEARRLGDQSPVSWAKLGAAEVRLGLGRDGLAKVQTAVTKGPASGELIEILATTALLAGERTLACESARQRLSMDGVTGFHFQLAALIHRHADRASEASAILRQGSYLFPDHLELREMAALSREDSESSGRLPKVRNV